MSSLVVSYIDNINVAFIWRPFSYYDYQRNFRKIYEPWLKLFFPKCLSSWILILVSIFLFFTKHRYPWIVNVTDANSTLIRNTVLHLSVMHMHRGSACFLAKRTSRSSTRQGLQLSKHTCQGNSEHTDNNETFKISILSPTSRKEKNW